MTHSQRLMLGCWSKANHQWQNHWQQHWWFAFHWPTIQQHDPHHWPPWFMLRLMRVGNHQGSQAETLSSDSTRRASCQPELGASWPAKLGSSNCCDVWWLVLSAGWSASQHRGSPVASTTESPTISAHDQPSRGISNWTAWGMANPTSRLQIYITKGC